jgi:hypothetical protein
MTKSIDDPNWTDAQRQFVQSLEQLGATKAEHAVPIDRTSPPSVRELQALIDSGVVREAAANGYYLYPRQVTVSELPGDERVRKLMVRMNTSRMEAAELTPMDGRRLLKTIVFWLLVMAIPIILIQLLGKNR